MQSEVFFVENDIHRRDKTNYYLDLAEAVSQRCTCLRRHYGAVIVKNDEVISTGYVGAPRGRKTARISANACAWKEIFPAVNAMSCAVAYMRKQTPSSAPRAIR